MLFKKKTNQEEEIVDNRLASEKIKFVQFVNDDEKLALDLVLELKDGIPLIINFEKLDEYLANKFIAFFTGANVALGYRPVVINENTLLFSIKDNFYDGSLNKFINELPRK